MTEKLTPMPRGAWCVECGRYFTKYYRSRVFCAQCDKKRIARIDEGFRKCGEMFDKDGKP